MSDREIYNSIEYEIAHYPAQAWKELDALSGLIGWEQKLHRNPLMSDEKRLAMFDEARATVSLQRKEPLVSTELYLRQANTEISAAREAGADVTELERIDGEVKKRLAPSSLDRIAYSSILHQVSNDITKAAENFIALSKVVQCEQSLNRTPSAQDDKELAMYECAFAEACLAQKHPQPAERFLHEAINEMVAAKKAGGNVSELSKMQLKVREQMPLESHGSQHTLTSHLFQRQSNPNASSQLYDDLRLYLLKY